MKRLIFFLSCCLPLLAWAQEPTFCTVGQAQREQEKRHPEIRDYEIELQRQILERLDLHSLSKYAKVTGADTELHIPVVFHVIHDYGNELVKASEGNLRTFVNRLNDIFNKRNADTAYIIPAYKGLIPNSDKAYIGNARIVFHLATKDPEGRPTTGITRQRSYMTNSGDDRTRLNAWPQDRYLNVFWVRDLNWRFGVLERAYVYPPAVAAVRPDLDGIITLADYEDMFLAHNVAHYLGLEDTYGTVLADTSAVTFRPWLLPHCGDEGLDDTPPTKGHRISEGCMPLALYDTACIYTPVAHMMKRRLNPVAVRIDTATGKGISFQNRTRSIIDSVSFYPAVPVGATYTIALSQDGTLLSSRSVVTTVKDTVQRVPLGFVVPAAPETSLFRLHFTVNPGAWTDSATAVLSAYPKGIKGSVLLDEATTGNRYNFFYDWSFRHGYFRIYGTDSLVDYPDTVNTQNVMDGGHCMMMFTYGQTERMRSVLQSSVAGRSNLSDPANLALTGALDPVPAMAPSADYAVRRLATLSADNEPAYFLCHDIPARSFRFQDFSWRAPVSTVQWLTPPGAVYSVAGAYLTARFDEGWNSVSLVAANASGSDTFTSIPGVYTASLTSTNPMGYVEEFTAGGDRDRWPIFNYYNNRYRWELSDKSGYMDHDAIRYNSYDDRSDAESLTGKASGDFDDFFSPGFDLSGLGPEANLNFRYAGAYATGDVDAMKDSLQISYSTNCGANWIHLGAIRNADLQTAAAAVAGTEYVPVAGDWRLKELLLRNGSKDIRDSRVFFRFRYRPYSQVARASGNQLYIDRISISNDPVAVRELIPEGAYAAINPNPAHEEVVLLFPEAQQHIDIRLTDMSGKLIGSLDGQQTGPGHRIVLPLTLFPATGMYLVQLYAADGRRQTLKLLLY